MSSRPPASRGSPTAQRVAGTVFAIGLAVLWSWVISAQSAGRTSLHDSFLYGNVILFGIAISLAIAAPSTAPFGRGSWRPHWPAAALLALCAAGLLMRALFLDNFPPRDGQLWEEAQMGKIAYTSIRYDSLDHFFPIPNLIAESGFRLFGVSMMALRLPFVAAGVLSVPVFFLAARALGLSRFAAIATTAMFATSAYLSAAARVALESHSPILTLCAALAAAFYACRRRTHFAMALAGVCCGLLMTEYTSFKLYPPLLLGMLVLGGANTDQSRWRSALGIGTFLLFACAVMVPLAFVDGDNPLRVLSEGVLRHGGDLAREQLSWRQQVSASVTRVGRSLSHVFVRGSAYDLLPVTSGVVDLYTGLLGLGATAYCAVRGRRSPPALFLATAIVGSAVLSGLLTRNPARYRLTPLPPLYFLAIGLALDALRRRWPQPAATAVLAAVIAGLCLFNVDLLFNRAMKNPRVMMEFGDRRIAVAQQIASLQERFTGPILLATAETYMGEVNDFSFLYDLDRVVVITDTRDLNARRGMLLADAARGDEIRALPTTSDCFVERYDYGERSVEMLVCHNRPPG